MMFNGVVAVFVVPVVVVVVVESVWCFPFPCVLCGVGCLKCLSFC